MQSAPRPTSLSYQLARALLSLLGAGLGWLLADWLLERQILMGSVNLGYLTVLGLLTGYLLSPPLAHRIERVWGRLRARLGRIPPDAVLAAGLGATFALIITVLLNSQLERIPGFTWYWSLLLTLVLVVASSWFFVTNRRVFITRMALGGSGGLPAAGPRPKIVDTSAIIDGRIVEVVSSHFLEGPLLVPSLVLGELQRLADADDPLRRRRGRRGLELLDRLIQQAMVKTEIVRDDVPEAQEVDDKLINLCLARGADLITTDYNLQRVAALQGIRVLNVNHLANAIKVAFLPGERLSLYVVKEGREPGQGVSYLEDGTMVVIEDAESLVGKTVEVVVTSNLQTTMGRMIFAKRSDGASPSSPG